MELGGRARQTKVLRAGVFKDKDYTRTRLRLMPNVSLMLGKVDTDLR